MFYIANVISGIIANERCTDHEELKEFIKVAVNG